MVEHCYRDSIYLAYDFYYSYGMLHFNVLVLACFSFCFYRLKILLSPLASTPTDWWAISREEGEEADSQCAQEEEDIQPEFLRVFFPK